MKSKRSSRHPGKRSSTLLGVSYIILNAHRLYELHKSYLRVINSLSEAEKEAVLNTRSLAPTEKLSVRRSDANDVLFDIESHTEIQDGVAEQLISLVGGDFGKFNGSVRNGKVVGIKTTKSNKVQDN